MRSDARLIGQTSYIYEAGCGVMIDGERTYLTGDWQPDEDGTPAERMVDARDPGPALRALRAAGSSGTRRGTPAASSRMLLRGEVDVAEANELLARARPRRPALPRQRRDRPPDGGDRGRAHAYHLVPGGASKAKGVAFHMRARGYAPEDCIAIGDSIEDLEAAESVGRFFCVANGPERDDGLREALAALPERDRDRGRDGRGLLRGRGLDPRGALRGAH